MSQIKTLPLHQDAKFIVIDEDVEAMYADDLIAGWINMWKSTSNSNYKINYLTFFNSKKSYEYLFNIMDKNNLKIFDYFTQNINNIYENNDITVELILNDIQLGNESIVIINCLSSLMLNIGLAKTIRFIEKLTLQVNQLICIYRNDFGPYKIPKISTLGTTYVKLNQCNDVVLNNDISYELLIINRKQGGGILKKNLSIIQDAITYEIKSEKEPTINVPKVNVQVSDTTPKPQASFRMDMNPRELEQKNKTPLPYTAVNDMNPTTLNESNNQSKIIYTPDSIDDYDEEDPDDDLPF